MVKKGSVNTRLRATIKITIRNITVDERIGFFDKINDSLIVNTVKKLLQRDPTVPAVVHSARLYVWVH